MSNTCGHPAGLINVANASALMAIWNPYNESNYLVGVAGENRNLTALFTNPACYLSSYEIYTGKELEMGSTFSRPLPDFPFP